MTRAPLVVLVAIIAGMLAPCGAGGQQPATVPRVGILFAGTPTAAAQFNESFTQGLRERGYMEGRSIIVERRYASGSGDRINEIAVELVRTSVDVIVTSTDPTIAALKRQTQSIPIVMVAASDPVGTGFVASLARPGANITGMSWMGTETSAKRLELLREAVPQLSRVAVIWNPDIRGALLDFKQLEEPARSMGVQLQSIEVSRADDLARGFSAIIDARAEALMVLSPNPVTFANHGQLVSFAQRHRLPSIYGVHEYVAGGGLMAYGASVRAAYRRAAYFVDRILKGTRPGDLPVEQPTTFELVINAKTAKALGMTIPPSLLSRADRVID